MVRVGQGMALTPRGEALVIPVRKALADLGRALATPEAFDPKRANRTFRVASIDLFDVLRMPAMLAEIRQNAPGVRVVVMPRGAVGPGALETGDIDLAIRARSLETEWSDPAEPSGIVERTVLRDGYSCFLRADHSALVDGGLTVERYAGAHHLLISPTGVGTGVADRVLADRGLQRQIALRLPEFSAALAVVESSDLILTAPSSLRLQLDRYPLVACVEPPLSIPGHRLALVWHERFTRDPAHGWLRALIAGLAKNFGQ